MGDWAVHQEYATREHLIQWAKRLMISRGPDNIIGDPADPYMHRWHVVPRNEWCNVYLHKIMRSDDDRALHDHPWNNSTLVLEGGYFEHLKDGYKEWRGPGWQGSRTAETLHRLELDPTRSPYALTLFTTSPKLREWGFACPKGWVHWQDFVAPTEGGNMVGQGCGEHG
jgi:hypothetical protein